jgi:hypothetical protein
VTGAIHMLGAGDGLRSQYIVLRVDRIDQDVLKAKLAEAGASSAIAPLVVLATDKAPKAVIDLALPVAMKQLEQYGVHARASAGEDLPPVRGASEFFPGLAVGAATVALVAGVGWGAWSLILKRVFA